MLVTGGTGFVGRRTIPALLERGHDVVALSRSDAAAEAAERMGADVVRGDLDDVDDLASAFTSAGADALMNIASLGFGHAPAIVAACSAAGLRRAVFVSTTAVFTKLNAGSKTVRLAAEETVISSGLDWTIVRPTMIYGGPDDRNLSRLLSTLERRPVMPLPGGGRRLQQPIHVGDLAAVLVTAIEHDGSIGRAFNVAGRDALPFREMVLECGRALGKRVVVIPVPLAPILWATRLNERWLKAPLLKSEQFERLAEDKSFDNGAAISELGFTPRTFAQGIRDELEEIGRSRREATREA